MIPCKCPHCDKDLKFADEHGGHSANCTSCGQQVAVPQAVKVNTTSQSSSGAPNIAEDRTLPPDSQAPTKLWADANGEAGLSRAGDEANREQWDFLAPPEKPDEIGRLGPYRVLQVLGAGGMGVVFRAQDPQLERFVALKAMLPALASTPTAKQRFFREARATAALKHPHIVTIFQVGEDHGTPFLAMEFLEGESLEDRLKRQTRLPVTDILRIGREIATGLAAAHDKGLIHRDIKPANIWLEGKAGQVKILDFGLARVLADQTQVTQSGAILGTPAYMAPEQAEGKNVDHRCDLFSLGCVLYRMSTGELPFMGNETLAILSALALETPLVPQKLNDQLPTGLSDLIQQLLAKKAADRPATAQAVVESLAALVRDLPLGALASQCKNTKPQPRQSQPPTLDSDKTVALSPTRGRSALWRWMGMAVGFALLLVLGLSVLSCAVVGAWLFHSSQGDPNTNRSLPPQDLANTPPPANYKDQLPTTLTIDLGGGVNMELLLLNAKGNATFQMGSPPNEKDRNLLEKAFDAEQLHAVELTKPFYLGKYPVTQEQYQRVMGTNPSHFRADAGGSLKVKGQDTNRFPVDSTGWIQGENCCQEMMNQLSDQLPAALRQAKYRFALPTEAQWEYACRADTTTAYSFGDEERLLGAYSWFGDNSGSRTHPVGEKKPNPWGLYDMHGNVLQWCADYYGPYDLPVKDPLRSAKTLDSRHVLRGGSWRVGAWGCRTACRAGVLPGGGGDNVGFRVSVRSD